MPVFYFHLHDDDGMLPDDLGCEFETLELATLDAFRSALAMGAELVLQQQDPASRRIEIVDGNQTFLTEVRFDEIFRPRVGVPRSSSQRAELRTRMAQARALRAEMRQTRGETHKTMEAVRLTMIRASGQGSL